MATDPPGTGIDQYAIEHELTRLRNARQLGRCPCRTRGQDGMFGFAHRGGHMGLEAAVARRGRVALPDMQRFGRHTLGDLPELPNATFEVVVGSLAERQAVSAHQHQSRVKVGRPLLFGGQFESEKPWRENASRSDGQLWAISDFNAVSAPT